MSIEAMKLALEFVLVVWDECNLSDDVAEKCTDIEITLTRAIAEAQSAEPSAWIVHGDGGLKTFTQTNPKHLVFPGGGSITPLYPPPCTTGKR